MKVIILVIFIFHASLAIAQNDYVKVLTSNLKQSWKLDSIKFAYGNNAFKIGIILTFKLDHKCVVYKGPFTKNRHSCLVA